MKKNYILDTNFFYTWVGRNSSNSTNQNINTNYLKNEFDNNNVFIPDVVILEVIRFYYNDIDSLRRHLQFIITKKIKILNTLKEIEIGETLLKNYLKTRNNNTLQINLQIIIQEVKAKLEAKWINIFCRSIMIHMEHNIPASMTDEEFWSNLIYNAEKVNKKIENEIKEELAMFYLSKDSNTGARDIYVDIVYNSLNKYLSSTIEDEQFKQMLNNDRIFTLVNKAYKENSKEITNAFENIVNSTDDSIWSKMQLEHLFSKMISSMQNAEPFAKNHIFDMFYLGCLNKNHLYLFNNNYPVPLTFDKKLIKFISLYINNIEQIINNFKI